MIEVALFPIPECVSFPRTVFPLHVFEPRYREMVNYCIENDMPLAICHTQKLIHAVKTQQQMHDILSSNQSTYKPYPVFSAGRCELVKVLDDGRMLINVHIEQRYKCVKEIQTLPFRICACETYNDEVESKQTGKSRLLQEKILKRLLELSEDNEPAQKILAAEKWREISPQNFSFEILALLKVEADKAQQMLEMRSTSERLQALLSILI